MHASGALFRALGINAAASAFGFLLSFARSVAMARLLSPNAFGLFGIATMAATGLQVLAGFGFRSVLIARVSPGDPRTQSWIDTIWTLECVKGLLVGCAMAVCAGAVAAFFNEPDARRLTYVLALATALGHTANTGLHLLERRLEFGRVLFVEQAGAVVALATAIALGLSLGSADALAWPVVASAVTTVTLSFVLVPTRPRLAIEPAVAWEATRAGGSLMVLGALTFLTTQFDNIVIGRVAGTEVLGVYLVAYNLAMFPMSLVGTIVGRVMLPDYSGRVQLDREQALVYWAHTMRATGWLLLAFALPMWLYADLVVTALYGDRWASAGQVLPILAIVGLMRGLTRGSASMLLALGLQGFDARAKAAETVLFVGLVLVFVGWLGLGMMGAAWAGLVCYGLAAVVRIVFLSRRAPLTGTILLTGFSRMAIATVLVGLASPFLMWRDRYDVVTLVPVIASVAVAGWFSEQAFRTAVQRSHAG